MATREAYRNALKDKLIGLEDSGYGDFEYADAELNTYLELAVARLYPAVYRRVTLENQDIISYGTSGRFGSVAVPLPERVFLVEDYEENETLYGWSMRPTSIVGIDNVNFSSVNIHYIDAYEMPADDVTDAGIPAVFKPLVVLGALIEALESRQDVGVRGDPGVTGQLHEIPLLDRLGARYEDLKQEMAMSLPGVTV